MIVGLKYAGGTDGFPARINVGDVVALRPDPRRATKPGGVAAYHNGKKVGYLSPDKQALWKSLSPAARGQAKVVGEILDESGEIVGLDVKIAAETWRSTQARSETAVIKEESKRPSFSIGRATLGIATLFLAFATMAHSESAGPERWGPPVVRLIPEAELIGAQEIGLKPEISSLHTQADQVIHLTAPVSPIGEDHEENGELTRKVQYLTAHRLTAERRLLSEAASRAGYFEAQAGDLARKLETAEAAASQNRQEVEDLKRLARDLEAQWQSRYRELTERIAGLQNSIATLEAAQQRAAEQEIAYNAWREMNTQELTLHTGRVRTWKMVEPKAETAQNDKPLAVEDAEKEEETASEVPVPKTSKKPVAPTIVQIRKRANFSRYTQNPDLFQGKNR